jgi:Uncharacterized conserved protein
VSSILDMVQQHLGPDGIQRISDQLGIPPGQAQAAVAAALPMVMGGMASQASQPGGAEAIHQAIQAHAEAPAADPGLMHGGAGGGGLIGRMLGTNHEQVQQTVSKASTLSPEKTGKLLMMLAPVVLMALARKHQQDGTTPQQLPQVLQQGQQEAAQQAVAQHPQLGGMLGGLLNKVMGGIGGLGQS